MEMLTEKRTNKQTELHHFRMMVIYLLVKFEFDWTNCFPEMVTDKRMHRITPLLKGT